MRLRPTSLRHGISLAFAAIAVGLLLWAMWLGVTLHPDHTTDRWDVVWTGYDVGLALAFGLTAFAAWRRSPWVGALAATTGTLLVVDAWFDIVLESHGGTLRVAILEAAVAEFPMAALCYWIAYRTERVLAFIVGPALGAGAVSHLAAAGESASEGHLVGVFEVAADGQAARESRHADTPT